MTELRLDVRWGAESHTGNRRSENQDAHLIQRPVFLVADGMGGHESGKAAAELVTAAFAATTWGPWATPQAVEDATMAADQSVRDLGREVNGSPGSTLTGVGLAVHYDEPCWLVFNVGDSRTYLLRGDDLEQVTVDHSQRQALLDLGMSPEESRRRGKGNVITQAIGGGLPTAPVIDFWVLPARPGDRILLCSDGLTGELSDQLIAATMLSTPEPPEAAAALVAAAVAGAGRDNVTALVVEAVAVHGGTAPPQARPADDTVDDADSGLTGDTRPDLEVVT